MESLNKSSHVPLQTLSQEAQTLLSNLLNPLKLIPTETNLPRDWRGVAELANVPSETMALLSSKPDPFKELLICLSGVAFRNLCVDDLKAFLGVIDRFDVLDDADPVLERDKQTYLARVSELQLEQTTQTLDPTEDANVLTFEDALRAQNGLPLSRYDAFVLYSEDDSHFAEEVVRRLEDEYSLKICSKDRDLLPGLKFEHEVIGKMIESRCNRLLVIFSPSFLESPANQFLVSYAQAVALDTRSRKIIPCVFKKCELPPSVRFSFCIDYNRSGKLWNFWDKLSQSLIVARKMNTHGEQTHTKLDVSNDIYDKVSIGSDYKQKQDPDSLEWWEAKKTSKLPDTKSLDATSDYMNGNGAFDEQTDAMSIHSQAKLLPNVSNSENKPSTWLRKIMNRKKRTEKDKSKKLQLAE